MLTRMGVILGTAAYMSPEQAKGRAADKRSDIWAFGCVLYEMLTARRAFAGEDISETMAAILRSEPEWGALPANAPARVRVVLRRCLQKDVKRRLRDIGDARIELEDAAPAPETPGSRWIDGRRPLPATAGWIAAVVLALTAGALALRPSRGGTSASEIVRFQVVPMPQTTITGGPAISPDGRHLAFTARSP